MRRITFLLATLLLLGACKEAKKASDRTASPYQELADQYAEFPLTTDLSKLTEKEKQMLPLLIEAADQMEATEIKNNFSRVLQTLPCSNTFPSTTVPGIGSTPTGPFSKLPVLNPSVPISTLRI